MLSLRQALQQMKQAQAEELAVAAAQFQEERAMAASRFARSQEELRIEREQAATLEVGWLGGFW